MKKKSHPKEYKEWIIPTRIKVGYQDIKVIESDLIDGAQGCYRADEPEIRVKEGMSKVETLNTILHEILHSIVYVYGLKEEFKDNDKEEKLVNALGNGLTEVLLRNPDVVRFIGKSV